MKFRCIQEIKVAARETWDKHNIYITLDLDWACDEVMLFTLDLLERYNISATWFVTHDTPVLQRIRDNPKFEIAVHPNFNDWIFSGKGLTIDGIFDELKQIVPEARSIRSHSLTSNSILSRYMLDKGFTHESNTFINDPTVSLKPYELPSGLIQACYNYGDYSNLEKQISLKDYLLREGLKILNFHPIHLFLNTQNLQQYNSARPYFKNYQRLKEYVNNNNGVRTNFEAIINMANKF